MLESVCFDGLPYIREGAGSVFSLASSGAQENLGELVEGGDRENGGMEDRGAEYCCFFSLAGTSRRQYYYYVVVFWFGLGRKWEIHAVLKDGWEDERMGEGRNISGRDRRGGGLLAMEKIPWLRRKVLGNGGLLLGKEEERT